jgi:hypothetical protein
MDKNQVYFHVSRGVSFGDVEHASDFSQVDVELLSWR